ncbi:unnamed protein product [Brassica oleracea var. botrytis]|uniref:Uncharacterized protein n=1 Tax=Brassica napus TaxID=3708 RepID=A0ABQ8A5Y2_BRANA|nr:hypothetical protein HID58_050371 [Brassica napus]
MNLDYVTACKVVDKPTRLYMMLHHMVSWALTRIQYGGQKNLLVIAKGIPGGEDDNMVTFLDSMIDRDIHVFTVVPDGCTPENFDYPEPILAWEWSAICSGGLSIDLSSAYPTDDDDDDDDDDCNSDGSISSETDLDCEVGSSSQLASETDDAGSRQKEVADAAADSQN